MRHRLKLLSALLVSLAFVGAGCSSSDTTSTGSGTTTTARSGSSAPGSTPAISGGGATGTVTVSAAASLTEPFKKIGDAFKQANPGVTEVTFNFDSSGTLSKQILDGAPADVFASADEANMRKLTDASLVAGTPEVFARNQLTIVVKKGNAKNVKTLADLATVGTISLCGTEVPCGRYADEILTKAGVTVPTDKVTRGQNVKATLAAVADGDADAGIVYVTDVTGAKVEKVAIPEAQDVIAVYPIGVIEASTHEPAAEAFVSFVLGPEGQATLQAAGFLPPS